MSSDLISREALKHRFAQITYTRFTADMGQGGFEMFSEKEIEDIIDKAPTVDTKDQIAGAYNEGYACGSRENARPQGEWIEKTDKYGLSYVCPFCGKEIAGTDLNYCVKCGAEMKGGAE